MYGCQASNSFTLTNHLSHHLCKTLKSPMPINSPMQSSTSNQDIIFPLLVGPAQAPAPASTTSICIITFFPLWLFLLLLTLLLLLPLLLPVLLLLPGLLALPNVSSRLRRPSHPVKPMSAQESRARGEQSQWHQQFFVSDTRKHQYGHEGTSMGTRLGESTSMGTKVPTGLWGITWEQQAAPNTPPSSDTTSRYREDHTFKLKHKYKYKYKYKYPNQWLAITHYSS